MPFIEWWTEIESDMLIVFFLITLKPEERHVLLNVDVVDAEEQRVPPPLQLPPTRLLQIMHESMPVIDSELIGEGHTRQENVKVSPTQSRISPSIQRTLENPNLLTETGKTKLPQQRFFTRTQLCVVISLPNSGNQIGFPGPRIWYKSADRNDPNTSRGRAAGVPRS